MKAIETNYKGFRFRSRLEARWAVLFDAMGIKYLYEPEGYALSDGTCYLPDFFLPGANQFFEVKGILSHEDESKLRMFVKEQKRSIAIGYDDFTFSACGIFPDGNIIEKKRDSVLMKCHKCGKYFFAGVSGSWECHGCGYYDGDSTALWICTGDLDIESVYCAEKYEQTKFKKAVEKAKQARFEHGERG